MHLNTTKTRIRFSTLVLASLLSWGWAVSCFGQYEANPLNNKKWLSVSAGANSADAGAWQSMLCFHNRSENLLTTIRFGFSQELGLNPNDTCTVKQNKTWELGLLWGDGYSGKRFYFVAAAGMGVVLRRQCKYVPYEDQAYGTRYTIGVPAQIQLGAKLSNKASIHIDVVGNWNFREPYVGALLGMSYYFKAKNNSSSNE